MLRVFVFPMKYQINYPGGVVEVTVENGIITQVWSLPIYHLPPDSPLWVGKPFGELYRHAYRNHWTVSPIKSDDEMPKM